MHKVRSLEQALQTNEHLMRELQHRVKNHIGIVVSLIRARARNTTSEEARAELIAVGERIRTLHLVHEQLYQSGASDQLPLRPFLSQLVERLCQLHESETGEIALAFDIADIVLSSDTAVPIGLIANEFVTNSLKYAFGDKGGTISVSVEKSEGRLRLCLRDNGKGLPSASPAAPPGSGTGMKLIEALANQVGSQAVWSSSDAGTMVCLDLNPASDRPAARAAD